MEPVSIICTNEGCVCENKLFTGKNAVQKAQKLFSKKMKEIDSSVKRSDIDIALDEGHYDYNGMAVFISEPEVIK